MTNRKPTDFFVIDDLIDESLSEDRKRALREWYIPTFAARRSPPSLAQQRVDVHDEPEADGGAERVDPVTDVDPESA